MYMMKRQSFILAFETAYEIWTNEAVQRRRHYPSPFPDNKPLSKDYKEFVKRLDSGEEVILGRNIVNIWRCFGCKPVNECDWHNKLQATGEYIAELEMTAMDIGAFIVNDKCVMVLQLPGAGTSSEL